MTRKQHKPNKVVREADVAVTWTDRVTRCWAAWLPMEHNNRSCVSLLLSFAHHSRCNTACMLTSWMKLLLFCALRGLELCSLKCCFRAYIFSARTLFWLMLKVFVVFHALFSFTFTSSKPITKNNYMINLSSKTTNSKSKIKLPQTSGPTLHDWCFSVQLELFVLVFVVDHMFKWLPVP